MTNQIKKDIVKITKKCSLNGVYNVFAPVYEGFEVKAHKLRLDRFNVLVATNVDGDCLYTSIVQRIKINKDKFKAKVYTMNSIYTLKFKAKEDSELFKQVVEMTNQI